MKDIKIVCFDAERTDELDGTVNDWLDNNEVEVISMSHSSSYDADAKTMVFSVCLLYSVEIP